MLPNSNGKIKIVGIVLLVGIIITGGIIYYLSFSEEKPSGKKEGMSLSSPEFEEGSMIPQAYTYDGQNISPPLTIENSPENTESFTIIVDDPDAPGGTWVHWLIWNISPSVAQIPENIPNHGNISSPIVARQGQNDWENYGYGGPNPPAGETHTYRFKLYALDDNLDLSAGASESQLTNSMSGHILAQAVLKAKY